MKLFPFKIIESFQFSGCFKVIRLGVCIFIYVLVCIVYIIFSAHYLYSCRPMQSQCNDSSIGCLIMANAHITSQLYIRVIIIFRHYLKSEGKLFLSTNAIPIYIEALLYTIYILLLFFCKIIQ